MPENKEKKESPSATEPEEIPSSVDHMEILNKTNEAAERLEKANEVTKQLLDDQAKIIVEQKLGGKADAGQTEKTEKDKEKEQMDILLKGTGYEGTIE